MKLLFILFGIYLLNACGFTIIDPGERGVKVTLGSAEPQVYSEGFHGHFPLISGFTRFSIKQTTVTTRADCFSADLQNINVDLSVLFRIPEASVVNLFQNYGGDIFASLINPRAQEALKEVTATKSAEAIVKEREAIKSKALELLRTKIGNLIIIEDLVIQNVSLSKELELAIEQKMVQEQEAAKAKFILQKTEIEAKTALAKAEGEAKAIKIKGDAIRENPRIIDLLLAEKWDGKSPLVVGSGANVLLPMPNTK